MSDLNSVCMIGRLTQKPEFSRNKNGTSILEFRIASNRIYYQNETKVEDTCFVDCVVFGQQAENMSKFLEVGKTLSLKGRLRYEEWPGNEGGKRSKHSIIVDELNFVGPKNGSGGEESTNIVRKKVKEVPF